MAGNNYRQCYMAASEAAGRELSEDELDNIFTKAQSRISRYTREGMTPAAAAQRAGRELGEEATLQRAVEARSMKINMVVKANLDARVLPGREADSIRAMTTGVERGGAFDNAGLSADAMGQARLDTALAVPTRALQKAGLLRVLQKLTPQFDRDLADEMGFLSDPTWGRQTGNKFAAASAKILHDAIENVRLMQNEAGAWIAKSEQYVTRQSHDADKILAAGFEKWRDAIYPRLDDKTFLNHDAPAERQQFLRDVYNALATGLHEGANGDSWLTGFKGPSNLAKKASAERKLFFKSSGDWHEYNAQYGRGTIASAAFHQIEHGARNAGIMSLMGTNPHAMLDGVVQRAATKLRDAGDQASHTEARKILDQAGKNSRVLDYAMHMSGGSEHPTFSKFMATWRAVNDMHMGGFLSYLSDIGTAGNVVLHSGGNMLDGWINGIKGLLPQGEDRLDAAARLGQGMESYVSDIHARSKALDGNLPARVKSLANSYEGWNGVKWWVRSEKVATAHMISSTWANLADKDHADLPPRLQRTLQRYGIGPAEWDIGRSAVTKMPDGNKYLFPDQIGHLPDEAFKGVANGDSAIHITNARQGLVDKFATAISDQTRTALSEPTAGIRDVTGFGRQPTDKKTISSEILQSVMQFKTFPLTHVLRSVTRDVMRNGLDTKAGLGLLTSTALLGYVSYAMKKLITGQEPVVPGYTDKLASGNSMKALMAGLAQGGGLGLYGDLLFGDTTRYGGSLADTLGGPTYGQINDLYTAFARDKGSALEGTTTSKKLATQATRLVRSNIPMANLWWAKAAINYALLYSAMETVNPGYLQRYQKQLTQDQGVKFLPGMNPATSPVRLRTFGR